MSGIFFLPSQCCKRFSSIRGTTLATWSTCGAPDFQLSLSLYRDTLSLLRHSSSCILCGISNSFIQIHIANPCTCFSSASLLRTMKYDAAGAQLPRAPDRTLGNAILFALPSSPKHIGALRVHELRFNLYFSSLLSFREPLEYRKFSWLLQRAAVSAFLSFSLLFFSLPFLPSR